jgi:ribonuclease HI|tara:strand:+ start:725 stop:1336 length:612 start_codon:yes stop_codon:yes gene_type:complete
MSLLKYFKPIKKTNDKTTETNESINNKLEEFGIETKIKCFTDGGCFNNGKKGARAGYGVFFGDNDIRNISEKVTSKQTNNVGELMAILRALEILYEDKKNKYHIELYTDSKYCLQIFERHNNKFNKLCQPWINKWRINNFKGIKNVEIIKKIDLLLKKFNNIIFIHVRSHQSMPQDINSNEYKIWYGNEQADKLANKGANLIS